MAVFLCTMLVQKLTNGGWFRLVGCSDCYLMFIFFVIIFKIFLKKYCLYKNKSYIYTIEITTTKK